jgi:hypothetical protein
MDNGAFEVVRNFVGPAYEFSEESLMPRRGTTKYEDTSTKIIVPPWTRGDFRGVGARKLRKTSPNPSLCKEGNYFQGTLCENLASA